MCHPPRGVAASGVSSIVQYSPAPPVGVWTDVSSSSVTDHPLKPVMRHSLGEPLPHQLADTIQANLFTNKSFPCRLLVLKAYKVLAIVSNCYPLVKRAYYLYITHPCAT